MATDGSFWIKEKEFKGEKRKVLSGYLEWGVTAFELVKNKYKTEGDNKPDFVAFSKTTKKTAPKNDEDAPF